MRIRTLAVTVAVAILLTACGDSSQNEQRQALLSAQTGFGNLSAANGMAAAFQKYAADEVTFLLDGRAPITGRAAIVRALKQNGSVDVTWSTAQARVSDDGTLGSTWGSYVAGAGQDIGYGKFMAVWQKQGGDWRIAAFATNESPGPGL
ncbi:MAG TPA: nuclear transport factor 2 family protein [Gammaproteobacteria bacterium]|nr:nuclear transport factor 2 family protein [Gammaproteobacteria bacterium]